MGGGQPIKNSRTRASVDVRKLRAEALYSIDEASIIRKSHENPTIKKMYQEFLERPGGEKSHKYLHTHYTEKEKYNIYNKFISFRMARIIYTFWKVPIFSYLSF